MMAMVRNVRVWTHRLMALSLGCALALMTSFPGESESDLDDRLQPVESRTGEILIPAYNIGKRRELEVDKLLKKKSSQLQGNSKKDQNQTQRQPRQYEVNATGIINPHPHNFVLTPKDLCKDELLAVIFVHSAPTKYVKRDNIRATWGNSSLHVNGKFRVIFAIASHTDKTTRQTINIEHTINNDIISEDFIDDYKNLTIKAVGALKWTTAKCKNVKFIVKTDDDTLVNIFSLMKHLSDLHKSGQSSNLLMCRCVRNMPVLRKGKWAVDETNFPDTHYPPYCSGLAFIMTMDVAKKLLETSYTTPVMWVDDAWLTGIVAQKADIKHTDISKVFSLVKENAEKHFLGKDWYQYLFAHLAPKAFMNVWSKMVMLSEAETIPESKSVVPGIVVNI